MGELSFLTIIVSLAVCSILVFGVYQYMKIRITILEQSQKEQALILQQYIEESSFDIQGLQSVIFRQQTQGQSTRQYEEPQTEIHVSRVEEVYDDNLNKHIHMDTVMYEAPNKQRGTLIAISSDSEDTTSDESSYDGSGSESGDDNKCDDSDSSDDGDSSDDSDDSDSSDSSDDSDDDSGRNEVNDKEADHEVKHIEISVPSTEVISGTDVPVEEIPIQLESTCIKTITVDLGTTQQITPPIVSDTIDVLSLLNKHSVNEEEGDQESAAHHIEQPIPSSSSTNTTNTAIPSIFSGLSVIELRALLKEKYKGHPEKITNHHKLKKPELIQLLQE